MHMASGNLHAVVIPFVLLKMAAVADR
jgi:hypothetical protein